MLVSAPALLLSRSWLSRGFPSGDAEGGGAWTESSAPPSAPSKGFADEGRVEELLGVLACLCETGEDREKPPAAPPLVPLLPPPAGEWRPAVEGEKGFPGTRGLPPSPGLARGILGDINEVGVAVSGLLRGEGLLTCCGHVRLGVRYPGGVPGLCPWDEALLLLGRRPEVVRPEPWDELLLGGRAGDREGVWAMLPLDSGRLGLVFS